MDIVKQALALYGADLTEEGFIRKDGKTTSVQVVKKGQRLRFEGRGYLLASGPIAEKTVCSFVEDFWFWSRV